MSDQVQLGSRRVTEMPFDCFGQNILLVSYFASFLHLNSQSLQILTYMFHPVAQFFRYDFT